MREIRTRPRRHLASPRRRPALPAVEDHGAKLSAGRRPPAFRFPGRQSGDGAEGHGRGRVEDEAATGGGGRGRGGRGEGVGAAVGIEVLCDALLHAHQGGGVEGGACGREVKYLV